MSEATTAQVRAWAQQQGIDVAPRGRVSTQVWDAYRQTHADAPVGGGSQLPDGNADIPRLDLTPAEEQAALDPQDQMHWLRLLAAGNYHRDPRLRAMQVGAVPRLDELTADVDRVIADMPPSTVKTGHVTGWTKPSGEVKQWSLLNTHGRTDSTSQDFNYQLPGKQVPAGLPALAAFAASIPDLGNLRLNMLGPGAALAPHEETLPRPLDGNRVGLRARFHLPIHTSERCLMLADDQWFHFPAGTVNLFNNGCVHAARNSGGTPRYHLVFDLLMTSRAYEAMFATGTGWITHRLATLEPVKLEPVTQWANEGGMAADEFDRRELVFHP